MSVVSVVLLALLGALLPSVDAVPMRPFQRPRDDAYSGGGFYSNVDTDWDTRQASHADSLGAYSAGARALGSMEGPGVFGTRQQSGVQVRRSVDLYDRNPNQDTHGESGFDALNLGFAGTYLGSSDTYSDNARGSVADHRLGGRFRGKGVSTTMGGSSAY
ncbi:uncharacterized protein [Cherax quadricarinatus]|uniref:uncharacterized protein n=1 Tax=Cherax quadricarinatus TaxID=27406 RepID=UPI002379AA1F|nr:uncharacterized protein LOC128691629 [Cherax quadricarinatus]XP_053636441.1 uncharacterized protein LOC128691629 [Cherax quadricarinatus]